MTTITLSLNELTPTTLAAIVANLTQNYTCGSEACDTAKTAVAIATAFAQLDSLVGYEAAEDFLKEAGAEPDALFDCVLEDAEDEAEWYAMMSECEFEGDEDPALLKL